MSGKTQNQFNPDYAISPGSMLEEWLEENGATQVELALRTGRSRKMINELVQGIAPVTAETAIQLERVTRVPASLWSTLEMKYRDHLARHEQRQLLGEMSDWVKKFPYKKMSSLQWIPDTSDKIERASHLLNFFGVASPTQWEETYACVEGLPRKSQAFHNTIEDLSAWLRQGEIQAAQIPCRPYNETAFRAALKELRGSTRKDITGQTSDLLTLCSNAGVVFVIVPELPKTHVSGFTRWLTPHKALIQQSLRHKRNDHLWFTFFHEAAHILLHGKKERFLEVEGADTPKEREANAWAADFLIPPHEWNQFVQQYKGRYNEDNISVFAQEQNIAPAIVAGRLQHERLVPPTRYKNLFVRLDFDPQLYGG